MSSIPAATAAQIRAAGPTLNMALVRDLYGAQLDQQSTVGVTVTRDLRYGDDVRHRLDIYNAEAPASDPAFAARDGLKPVLVFFHGGGFIRGDKSERLNCGLYFSRQGFTVAVPNYRLAPQGRWPAGAEDVASVVRWLRAQVAQHGGDAQRIILMGESAGAAHVAAATLWRRFHAPDGHGIAGAVLVSGVYNARLEWLARRQFGVPSPDPRNEPYFGSDAAAYAAMSTVEHIDAAPFPLLMTFADLDLLQMQVQAGELFARLVVKHGFSPELRVIAGHNHLTQVYSLNTGDESLTAPVLEFIRATLRRGAA